MENNCTIIRVWFCKADGGENVGHATLQTPNEYLSLWPNRDSKAKTTGGQIFEHRPGVYFNSCYQEDLTLEGRPPEFTCSLYSLNVSKMDKKILELKSETNQWSVAGNTFFGNWTGGVSRSCAGAVREALIAGDMKDLTGPGLFTNLMTSPHNILTWAREAKKVELQKYPQTKDYDCSRGYEYNPRDEVTKMAIFQALGLTPVTSSPTTTTRTPSQPSTPLETNATSVTAGSTTLPQVVNPYFVFLE